MFVVQVIKKDLFSDIEAKEGKRAGNRACTIKLFRAVIYRF
jgi:hypothetical protein